MSQSESRNTETQKQAKTWLIPGQIERIRDACLSEAFPTYLQDRNETIITVLADTGVRVGELVALDWGYFDLEADPGEVYLPSEIQKGDPGASYLDLNDSLLEFLSDPLEIALEVRTDHTRVALLVEDQVPGTVSSRSRAPDCSRRSLCREMPR